MGSTTIHPFHELRALAEEEARAYATTSDGTRHEAVELYARVRFTLMLCDLERPASRDAVARLVAARIGWNVSDVTAAVDWNWNLYVALHRTARMTDPDRWEPHPPSAEALALIVRHLWPEESP